jgi:hypothetical protein
MQLNALEEAGLTENTNDQQPQTSETPAPQPEQETTALASVEPEVIEGEVIDITPPETSEHHTPPKQIPYWLFIPFTILCCLLFVAAPVLLPLLSPSATITLIPVERTITLTTAMKVQGRELPPLTLMQSTSIQATGNRHQPARQATGTITFTMAHLLLRLSPKGQR